MCLQQTLLAADSVYITYINMNHIISEFVYVKGAQLRL